MATKDSALELHEITTDSEGSDADPEWGDSDYEDPDFDVHEETQINFSNFSLKHNPKTARVVEDKGLGEEVLEATSSVRDGENFDKVQKLIEAGLVEKLKVDECKLYLRKNGLRLTGNKETLIQRIKEHLEILHGGEKKYPPSSFVLNCKGDACTGDVVLFEQNVYEMFNIASRSASGPPCGKRIVAGRIVKESYGAAKQQHTFTIEVLWSKGEKPLPPLHPLLIKGRNLYRLKTMRQKWEDEVKRQKILMEKHSRGSFARADREARIQEKEKRKKVRENRVSKKDSARNQCQETNVPTNLEKSEFPSRNSGLSAHIGKETLANKPLVIPGQCVDSKTMAMGMGSDQLETRSFPVHHIHNQQPWNPTTGCRSTFNTDHMRGASLGANYNYANLHFREIPINIEKNYPFIAGATGFTGWNHQRVPLANANYSHPMMPNRESHKQTQLCRHYSRGRCYFGDTCKFLHDLRDTGNV
ncbi:zinc finger CCCH domain-containing protein 62 [Cajanus cajan]|uniref:zinc finger CCCH domain-containing protein 62 n=1 Tax=Cajanus cajan TaxID=3821 RepID=UPI00098DAC66|nr:zinc finger CCCH domain-containing protein 62 [Cajanus cajan]